MIDKLQNVKSEELLSRFRSKIDLYKYFTLTCKLQLHLNNLTIVRLYLPSYGSTKLAFIRAILQNKKKVLKTTELIKINIPRYEELSVRNLYDDVMKDPDVSQYLPDLEQNSSKLPEREFFFNVLGTVKTEYLNHIIEEAEKKRYKG